MPRIDLIGIWCRTNRTQDYGNSENTTAQPVKTGDYACGAMEAIYFGDAHWQGNTGAGKTGPWLGVRRSDSQPPHIRSCVPPRPRFLPSAELYGSNGAAIPMYVWRACGRGGGGPYRRQADLEAGMFYGGGQETKINPTNKPLTSDFVSLHLKGRTDGFALKGGDATQGTLQTMYDGVRCANRRTLPPTTIPTHSPTHYLAFSTVHRVQRCYGSLMVVVVG
eukprot:COSAG01_NODE_391_length_17672_cov_4.507369_8_plen_221_part_00